MDVAQLIHSADFDGVRLDLTPEGKLHYSGDPALIKTWLPILRENKNAIVAELHRERRHKKVLSMLGDGRKYAVLVENDRTDPVIATCAIRGIATFELAIPKHSYDGLILMELLEKHSTEMCATPSQSSDDVTPSTTTRERAAGHPAKGAA